MRCEVIDFSFMLWSITSLLTEKPLSVKLCPCEKVHTTLKTSHNFSWCFERWSPKNKSKRSLQKSKFLNFSFGSNQATFKNSSICDFGLSPTLDLILWRAKKLDQQAFWKVEMMLHGGEPYWAVWSNAQYESICKPMGTFLQTWREYSE